MKFPFSFNIVLVFRLILPGLALAVALMPAAIIAFDTLRIPWYSEIYFTFGSITLGWLIVLLDMPIYMVYEGRRFWPAFLTKWGFACEERRLRRLGKLYEIAKKEKHPRIHPVEYSIRQAQFPLNEQGEHEVRFPTRIGNLINEYEEYPDKKYGMDGVFYWYRVWLVVPKELREELDQQQAMADSALYMSFVLYVAGILCAAYAVIEIQGWLNLSPNVGHYWIVWSLLALFCGYTLYCFSLQAHAQYGSFFKAMFDKFHNEVDVKPLLRTLSRRTGIEDYENLEEPEAYKMVWRYLRWHELRGPGQTSNVNAEELFVERHDEPARKK